MVYINGLYLFADEVEELHSFAKRSGIELMSYFNNAVGEAHYVLDRDEIIICLLNGAIEVDDAWTLKYLSGEPHKAVIT